MAAWQSLFTFSHTERQGFIGFGIRLFSTHMGRYNEHTKKSKSSEQMPELCRWARSNKVRFIIHWDACSKVFGSWVRLYGSDLQRPMRISSHLGEDETEIAWPSLKIIPGQRSTIDTRLKAFMFALWTLDASGPVNVILVSYRLACFF